MKIAVAQIDTTVGDFSGNSRKILELGRAFWQGDHWDADVGVNFGEAFTLWDHLCRTDAAVRDAA